MKNLRSQSFGKNICQLKAGRNIRDRNVTTSLEFTNKMKYHINVFGPLMKLGILNKPNSRLVIRIEWSRLGLRKTKSARRRLAHTTSLLVREAATYSDSVVEEAVQGCLRLSQMTGPFVEKKDTATPALSVIRSPA